MPTLRTSGGSTALWTCSENSWPGFCCSSRLIRRIGDGLLFLQKQNVAHWDIKANNILISRLIDAIIADLGESLVGVPPSKCFDLHMNFASGNSVRSLCRPYVSCLLSQNFKLVNTPAVCDLGSTKLCCYAQFVTVAHTVCACRDFSFKRICVGIAHHRVVLACYYGLPCILAGASRA